MEQRKQLSDLLDGADLGVHVLASAAHGQPSLVFGRGEVADVDTEMVAVDQHVTQLAPAVVLEALTRERSVMSGPRPSNASFKDS